MPLFLHFYSIFFFHSGGDDGFFSTDKKQQSANVNTSHDNQEDNPSTDARPSKNVKVQGLFSDNNSDDSDGGDLFSVPAKKPIIKSSVKSAGTDLYSILLILELAHLH